MTTGMKNYLFWTTFYCLMIFANSQGTTYTCDPATDCKNVGAGKAVPDPSDCEKYYFCITVGAEIVPSTSSIKCNNGSYFDQVVGGCSVEPTPGTCGPNVCPILRCESKCPTVHVENTYVANKYDCTTYYICLSTAPLLVGCPSSTPYFDGATCVADISKCCDFCTPYCVTPGTQIVDPCDCTSYYICLDIGLPQDNHKGTCGPGKFYDEITATCLTGTCVTICPSCGQQTTTTTTTAATTTTTTLPTETTPSTTTTSPSGSTPTTPTAGCDSLASFTCSSNGNFRMCPYCFKYFFNCSGGTARIEECSGITVFNPNPQYPYCLNPSSCPYP